MPTTSFPTGLDTSTNLPSPSSSDLLDNTNAYLDHDYQHDMLNDMLAAAQSWLGTSNSSVQDSLDWRYRHLPRAPRTANAMDDEFDGSTSLSSSLWTFYQQTLGSHTVQTPLASGSCVFTLQSPYTGGEKMRGFFQTVPSGNWMFETCVNISGNRSGYFYTGLILAAPANVAHEVWGRLHLSTNAQYTGLYNSRLGSDGSFVTHIRGVNVAWTDRLFLRAERSGTTLNYYWSLDGQYFELFESHTETTYLTGGVGKIGIGVNATNFSGTPALHVSYEYFRRIS